jgi:hypothetical protein
LERSVEVIRVDLNAKISPKDITLLLLPKLSLEVATINKRAAAEL